MTDTKCRTKCRRTQCAQYIQYAFILLLLLVVCSSATYAQVTIRNLPQTTPAASDLFPFDRPSGGTWSTSLTGIFSLLTCIPPMACDSTGTVSLTGVGTYTPTINGGPIGLQTVGSTNIGASIQGQRKAVFSLWSTNATGDDDSVLLALNLVETAHTSGLARTAIDCKSFTEPDIGGETSCYFGESTGGGAVGAFYVYPPHRPTGYTDYSTTSQQPAIEIGTAAARPALGIVTGVRLDRLGTMSPDYRAPGIRIRLDGTNSEGWNVEPADNTYNGRLAFYIGNWQQNAAPVNVHAYGTLAGDSFWNNVRAQNVIADNSSNYFELYKSRAGVSVATDDPLGDLRWKFVNSTPAEVEGGRIRLVAANKTSGAEVTDYHIYAMKSGTLTDLWDIRGAGQLEGPTMAAPSAPAAGRGTLYFDSTDLRLHDKGTAGTVGTTVVADIGASNNFLTAISAAGVISKSQPGIANLSSSTSSALATILSDETGSGLAVFATSPTLTTPVLGVATATSINSTTIPASKILVVTTDNLSVHAATTSAQLAGVLSDETGSGLSVFSTSPTLTTPVLGVATATTINGTTIPTSKTLVVTTDNLSVHAATTSAQLAGVLSDETGSGVAVFGTSPTLTTPILGTATATALTVTGDNPMIIQRGTGTQGAASGIRFKDQAAGSQAAIGTEGGATNDLQVLAVAGLEFRGGSNLLSTGTGFNLTSTGHIANVGTAPTVACTGTGTSPAAPTIIAGGTDKSFTIVINTGTGSPANTGTCTVTFANAYTTTNKPQVVCTLQSGATSWGIGSGIEVTTSSLSAPVLTWWSEVGVALTGLTVSTSYQINCIVEGGAV